MLRYHSSFGRPLKARERRHSCQHVYTYKFWQLGGIVQEEREGDRALPPLRHRLNVVQPVP